MGDPVTNTEMVCLDEVTEVDNISHKKKKSKTSNKTSPPLKDLPPQIRHVLQEISNDRGLCAGTNIPSNTPVDTLLKKIEGRATRELQNYMRLISVR